MTTQEIVASAERQAVRERHQVRIVTEKEDGYSIHQLPKGIYGFCNSPATEELPLFIRPTFRCSEIHKLADGSIHIVGYVTPAELAEFEKGAESVSLNLYPEPFNEAQSLIVVPLSRVDGRRPPSRDGGNWMPVEVAPK